MPTYEYECPCGAVIEVVQKWPPPKSIGSPCHPAFRAPRAFLPGNWTGGHSVTFVAGEVVSLGERFSTAAEYRNRLAQLRDKGIVPLGDAPRGSSRRTVDPDTVARELQHLTRAEVLRMREKRERAEWEERNG